MDVVEIIPDRIYSIKYDGENTAEYYRLFEEEWTGFSENRQGEKISLG